MVIFHLYILLHTQLFTELFSTPWILFAFQSCTHLSVLNQILISLKTVVSLRYITTSCSRHLVYLIITESFVIYLSTQEIVKQTKLELSSFTEYHKDSGYTHTLVYGVKWNTKSSPHFGVIKSFICELKNMSIITH